ncbi:hypothetical protein AKJ16_DCAP18108 [Drosera capensis]
MPVQRSLEWQELWLNRRCSIMGSRSAWRSPVCTEM